MANEECGPSVTAPTSCGRDEHKIRLSGSKHKIESQIIKFFLERLKW